MLMTAWRSTARQTSQMSPSLLFSSPFFVYLAYIEFADDGRFRPIKRLPNNIRLECANHTHAHTLAASANDHQQRRQCASSPTERFWPPRSLQSVRLRGQCVAHIVHVRRFNLPDRTSDLADRFDLIGRQTVKIPLFAYGELSHPNADRMNGFQISQFMCFIVDVTFCKTPI